MNKWERFKAWDERTERDHPKVYALINIVTGLAFAATMAMLMLVIWAAVKL